MGCEVPMLLGACCFDFGLCVDLYEPECFEQEGSFLGEGTSCNPNPCPGACCFPDHSCEVLTEGECSDQGGVCWRGTMTCNPNPCPLILRVPEKFATIQAALDQACDGDTVLVAPGVYTAERTAC
jgi:hypothetical protein